MRIVVLHVPGCPNVGRARGRLHQALAASAVTATVDVVEVTTEESAANVGMHGSPTILIDGVDPFSTASAGPSLSCRLFDTPAGLDGAPTVGALIAALAMTPVITITGRMRP